MLDQCSIVQCRDCAVWSNQGLEADNQAYLQKNVPGRSMAKMMAFCKALFGSQLTMFVKWDDYILH